MTDFREYICWNDDAVVQVSPRDAASLSDPYFQAIHHPLRLRRRRLDQREGGEWSSEEDVLAALKGGLRPDGYLFIPIVGGSGTGKSHLVRWVKDQVQTESDWLVRYLPKNRTGLRRAIEIVIKDLSGPKIEEVRAALLEAPSQSESDTILAERLLDELALLVSQMDPSEEGDQRSSELRKKLVRELPDLLRDPVVRRKLVADGAVIQRLVGLALRGREDGDGLDDDATHFLKSDFPLTFEEIGDATRVVRLLLGKFATIPQLTDAAVSMINEALPAAEKRVAVSNNVDLVEVFREVRRALHSQGKQLAFFVEDFTVLHGVEREFLDAIVEPKNSADGEMCGLRMIFAITEGHFDGLDTVRTRCDDAYWLDATYGDSGVDLAETISFVGRYFNATRLERQDVDTAWNDRRWGQEDWVPNACQDCVHQVTCHESFGVSDEGYGLYPLNKEALSRFVGALSVERFDPRDVVREVVNRFLLQGSKDLNRKSFPSDFSLSQFDRRSEPMAPLMVARITELSPVLAERAVNVLRFWSSLESRVEVEESVLEAFGMGDFRPGLRTLQESRPVGPPKEQDRPDVGPGTTSKGALPKEGIESQLKPPQRRFFLELAGWSKKQNEMSAGATFYFRKLIAATIHQNLDFGAVPVNLGVGFDASRFGDSDVMIEGSVTRQIGEGALIVVERDQTTAAALQSLLLFKEIDSGNWPDVVAYRRVLAAYVERWTADVTQKLAETPSEAIGRSVRAAIVASAVLGHLGRNPTDGDYVAALFAHAKPYVAHPDRSSKWTGLVDKAARLKLQLADEIEAYFGESRGRNGGIRMIQADVLLPLVKAFTSTWVLQDASNDPFLRTVSPAVDHEWDRLMSMLEEIQELVDPNRSWDEQTARVLTTIRTASDLGRLTDVTALSDLSMLAEQDSKRVMSSYVEASSALNREFELREKLTLLAGDVPRDVGVIHRFALRAVVILQRLEDGLASRQDEGDGAQDLEQSAVRVLKSTTRFDDAVRRTTP